MNFAELAASKLVPGAFREFLPFVSPSGLRVIHKERVLNIALKCTANTLRTNVYNEAFESIQRTIQGTKTTLPIQLSTEGRVGLDLTQYLTQASPQSKKEIGETILELYFLMVENHVPFFLDLRPEHFRFDSASTTLIWSPSRLWFERTPHFHDRIRALYRGFFNSDASETQKGLELYAWEATPDEGYFSRINVLLNHHFGEANSKEVLFSISHFKSTFGLLFEETIRSRSRLHPELTFIGTALAGLYLTLEKIGTPLDVARSYRNTVKS